MQQPQQENRSSNCHPLQGKLSPSSLPLSSLINRYCVVLPNFYGNLYIRQPGTSLSPHNPDPRQHTALPPRHLRGCEDTKKMCTVLHRCRRYHTCRTPWRSRQCCSSWSLPLISTLRPCFPKKASTGLSLTPGRAVHFSQIPSW